jgi:hypothetical protein
LQATAIERERTRRETAVAGIAQTLKSMAVSRNKKNATLHGVGGNNSYQSYHNHRHGSLYKRTSMQDAASVLSIPSSDSSVSLISTLGSSPSNGPDFLAFA